MKKSLIIYETYYGISKRVSDICARIIGNANFVDVNNYNEIKSLEIYDNIFFVFSFHGYDTAEKIKKYINMVKDKISSKKIGLFGVGLREKDMKSYTEPICKALERKADYIEFIEGELRISKLTTKDKETLRNFLGNLNMKLTDMGKFKVENVCDLAYKYREIINKPTKEISKEELVKSISEFLAKHNTCSLASSDGEKVRVTPIEYIYYENSFYFITEGGLKFNGIIQNPNVSIAVYEEYTTMSNLKGLQITGEAKLLEIDSNEDKKVRKYIYHKNNTCEKVFIRFIILINEKWIIYRGEIFQ